MHSLLRQAVFGKFFITSRIVQGINTTRQSLGRFCPAITLSSGGRFSHSAICIHRYWGQQSVPWKVRRSNTYILLALQRSLENAFQRFHISDVLLHERLIQVVVVIAMEKNLE